ncbi:MAG: VacB/RNase II family 3'-5' exoribonuclease [Deltaproteobacteria bacterium]|nr:VacB/RNase II family 3'-5' exoribonuclease [Deltaproteobacteria bacterium]
MALTPDAILEILRKAAPEGLQVADIAEALSLPRDHRSKVRRALKLLAKGGMVEQSGRHYRMGSRGEKRSAQQVEGVLKVTPAGHGYVDEGDDAYDGVYVAPVEMGGAMDGDRVTVSVWPDDYGRRERRDGPGRRRGEITRVLERGRTRLVGVLDGSGGQLTLKVDDARMTRPVELDVDAASTRQLLKERGNVVLGEIVAYPQGPGEAVVVKPGAVLGRPDDVATEVERVLWEEGVEQEFSPQAEKEAAAVPEEISEADLVDRLDLRHLDFLTIDPETARDFDDAVTVERLAEDRARVWVAVADVSHYVREDSALDVDAQLRGSSVYLPGRAIPMLPEALSARICSLVPEADRLAMVVRFDLNLQGEILEREAMTAVIRSRARLDYPGVAAALQGDFRGRRGRYLEHGDQLEQLAEVSGWLRNRRDQRGALLDLDLPEGEVVLDEDDPMLPRDVVARGIDPAIKRAYNLIEELMIAANEAVAQVFVSAEQATLWRIHAPPRRNSLELLSTQLASYGFTVEPERIGHPGGMARLLTQLAEHPASRPLSYLTLRALQQAQYRAENLGHFGLASEGYLHFTSPIRRYPDLHVHRLLKATLAARGLPAGGIKEVRRASPAALNVIARDSSDNERRAMDVERRVKGIYAAALMRDRVGDRFAAFVNGMATFGLFVTIDQPYVDGMVPMESLPGRVDFDPAVMRFLGRHGAPTLALGERVEVEVMGANISRGRIELRLVSGGRVEMGDPQGGHRGRGGAPRRAGGGRRARGRKGRF